MKNIAIQQSTLIKTIVSGHESYEELLFIHGQPLNQHFINQKINSTEVQLMI